MYALHTDTRLTRLDIAERVVVGSVTQVLRLGVRSRRSSTEELTKPSVSPQVRTQPPVVSERQVEPNQLAVTVCLAVAPAKRYVPTRKAGACAELPLR